MVTLTVGKNSFGTIAEADAYLDGSIVAATNWLGVAPDDKKRSMISAWRQLEAQTWIGTASGMEIIDLASVSAAGTGYLVNDVLTVAGGTFGEVAFARVATIGGSGVVATVELLHAGTYSETPSSPAATTGGTGSGCTLTLTFIDQISDFPRTDLIDCDGRALTAVGYPTLVKEAQFRLAYEMSQDATIEQSPGGGSNTKRVRADTVEVEYFRPESNSRRFPVAVQDLIGCLLAGTSAGSIVGGYRGGAGATSVFNDWPDGYGLSGGF